MVSTSTPVIVVSYGGREESLTLSVRPSLELSDAEADQAADHVWKTLKEMFSLSSDTEVTLHETESGRTMSKESFRDPAYLVQFPKFWYLTVENATAFTFHSFEEDEVPATDSSDLVDLLDMQDFSHSDVDESDLYPSLLELSMDHTSPALGSSHEDLIPITVTCNESGDFGIGLRHLTVLANIPHSEQSDSEGGSQTGSRCSNRSTESYDTLRMSTVFVRHISVGSPAECSGLQIGDIVNSINGKSVSNYTVEEIQMLLSENKHELVLWVSSDRQDDLLFLYPQYLHGETGEYERSANEKIVVADIETKVQHFMSMGDPGGVTSDPSVNLQSFAPAHIRSASADDRLLHGIGSFLFDNSFNSFHRYTPSVQNDSAISIDSEEPSGLNSSTDDLLITGSLADIPVEQSPSSFKQSTKSNFTSLDLAHQQMRESYSQEWMPAGDHNQTESTPEWFPNSANMVFSDSLPVDGSSSGDVPVITENSHVLTPAVNGKRKIAKFKKTLKNLTGSSTDHKAKKSNSPTIIHTSSTSALDTLRVNSTQDSFTPPAQRSLSSELGGVKPHSSEQLSLQFLTGVSSVESVPSTFNSETESRNCQARPESEVLMSKPQMTLTTDMQQPSPVRSSEGSDMSDSSYNSLLYLSQEHGKHTSGETLGANISRGRHRDRSYRSQRLKLHKRSSVISRGASSEDVGSTSVPAPRNTVVSKKPLHRKPQRAAGWSNQPLSFSRQENFVLDQEAVSPSTIHNSLDPIPLSSHGPDSSLSSRSALSRTASLGESLAKESGGSGKQLVSTAIEVTSIQPNAVCDLSSKLKSGRRTISATSSTVKRKVDHSLRQRNASYDPSEAHLSTHSGPLAENSTSIQEPKQMSEFRYEGKRGQEGKPQLKADFHGPVHKKQVKEGGKKAQDRSWRPVYAAIRGHHLIFYENDHDFRKGIPLSHDPSLDLHECMMLRHASKQRPFTFGLELPNGSESLIQAESEDSLQMWTRIIHNLNRWHRRMPASNIPRLPHSQELPRNRLHLQGFDKRPSRERSRTPQPPIKKEERSKTHFRKIIQRLRANSKDVTYTNDTSYITFGVPLEDCPASIENKRIPLLLSICVEEIEKNWLDTEGLYRVAGPIKQVNALCAELDKGNYSLLQGLNDAHTITSTLKKFLKELPDPVIPNALYSDFVSCGREADKEENVKRLQELVDELPAMHFHTLAFLIRHLKKVETFSKENKMDQNNLCLVFGPTVIRKADDAGLVFDMKPYYKVMELFMVNYRTFFKHFLDTYDQKDNATMSVFEKRNVLRRGVSDPYQRPEDKSQSRRSWDGGARILSLGSQSYDASLLSGELGASQSRSKSHLKPRLGRTRQVLTNQSPEDTAVEHGQIGRGNAALISPTTSYPVSKRQVTRKISYMEAMHHGQLTMNPLTEDKLSHLPKNAVRIGGQYPPRQISSLSAHSRLHQSAHHHYSLDDRHGTEIIGQLDPIPFRTHVRYPPRETNQGSFS